MAASGLLLGACASNQSDKLAVAVHPPIVVDGYNTPSAAELYAQRYQSSVTQVKAGDDDRFVTCEQSCPGVTPKTPVATLNAAVVRRAQQNLQANRTPMTATSLGEIDEPLTTAVTENAARTHRYRDDPDDADGSAERK
ncbi:MAG: hypothetical protein KJP16_05975 [Gammaproteobacteria bacterium]|nr:hypothetical protein [Gammaproteobacteria bacterium]